MSDLIYLNPRPQLSIEFVSSATLGNCYHSAKYRITSSSHRVSRKQIDDLRAAGFLGYGQEFYVRSQCDGNEEPAGFDEVNCVDVKNPGAPAINRYTGVAYEPIKQPYFTYEVEDRVDSGD